MRTAKLSPALAARLLAERRLQLAEAARPALFLELPPADASWLAPERQPQRDPTALVLDADGEFTEI